MAVDATKPYDDQNIFAKILRGEIPCRKVFEDGDPDAGIWTVGTVMGLINDIPTCEELVHRMVREAEEIITGRLAGMVTAAAKV